MSKVPGLRCSSRIHSSSQTAVFLGFGLRHVYQVEGGRGLEHVYDLLKGSDATMYRASLVLRLMVEYGKLKLEYVLHLVMLLATFD